MKIKSKKKILTFLGITLVLSSIFYGIIIKSGTLQAGNGIYVAGLMWVPGISGIITQLLFEHSLRGMGWKLGKFKYLLLAYIIPLIYCLVVYGITWITGLGGVPNQELMNEIKAAFQIQSPTLNLIIYCLYIATVGVLTSILSAAGEEIGWRGLFVPELSKITSFRNTALISGVVWTLWHMPLILFADYSLPGVPKWYALLMFTIMLLGISTVFSYLTLKSGSMWPAILLHASHNIFVQSLFTPLTIQTQVTPYIIDEFGAGLALAGIVLAIIFIKKGKELTAR